MIEAKAKGVYRYYPARLCHRVLHFIFYNVFYTCLLLPRRKYPPSPGGNDRASEKDNAPRIPASSAWPRVSGGSAPAARCVLGKPEF
jgi:hypothetical protein